MSKILLPSQGQPMRHLPGRLLGFLLSVGRDFKANQGLLLSGALAYYTLLSIVPISILFLVGLSHLVDEARLFNTLSAYMGMVIPGYKKILTEQVRTFLEHRQAVGIIGFLAMLFFSSLAFTVLEKAMSVIFAHRVKTERRTFLVSAIIPYLYILGIGLAIGLVSFTTAALEVIAKSQMMLFGWSFSFELPYRVALYILRVMSEMLLLTSFYVFMPVVRIRFRYALIGGITATALWEITRRGLVWFYSSLSMVNLIYGSFATAVVALVTAEAIALIFLLGAQVIAELERGKL